MKLRTEEKFAFLHLAQYVAKLDEDYSQKEREVIEEYCMEMGVENIDVDLSSFRLEENLATFLSDKSRKIAVLALMVLVHIDDKYGLYEQKVMHQIADAFHFSHETMDLFSMWGKDRSAMYEQALLLTSK